MEGKRNKKENRLNKFNIIDIRNEFLDKIFKLEAKLNLKYNNEVKLLRFIFDNDTKIIRYTNNSLENIDIYGFIVIAIKENKYCEILYEIYESEKRKLGKLIFDGVTYGFKKCNKITTRNLNVDIDVCLNKNKKKCKINSSIISDSRGDDCWTFSTNGSNLKVKLNTSFENSCFTQVSASNLLDTNRINFSTEILNTVLKIIIKIRYQTQNNGPVKTANIISCMNKKGKSKKNKITVTKRNFSLINTKTVSITNSNGSLNLIAAKPNRSNNINLDKMNDD